MLFRQLLIPGNYVVLQEDFEMAVAKVMKKDSDKNMSLRKLFK